MRLNLSRVFSDEITRRYFILNGFDGALTVLGVILGTYVAHVRNPVAVLGAGLGASVAMGLSGLFAAYMTEKAETSRRMKELERAMLRDLEGTVIAEATKRHILQAAVIDGVSPAATTILCLIPYVLVLQGFLGFDTAFGVALGINLLILAALGAYLGRISERNILYYAGVTIGLGIVVASVTILVVTLI